MKIKEPEYFLMMDNAMPQNKDLSDVAVVAYVLLRQTKSMFGYGLASMEYIAKRLLIKRPDKHIENIQDGLRQLVNAGYIELYDIGVDTPILAEKLTSKELFRIKFAEQDREFFQIYIEDLDKIIHSYSKYKVRKIFALIRYYLVIQRWTNFGENDGKRHVANSTIKHIITDNRTVQKLNHMLQQLEIFWYENGYRSISTLKEISTRFARCRDIGEEEFRAQVADWAFAHGYEKFNKEDANELKRLHKQKEWEKIKSKQYQQQVKEQFIHISDDYLRSLLRAWGLENELGILDFKRAIIENEILLDGEHIDFEDESLEECVKWASRGVFNMKIVYGQK